MDINFLGNTSGRRRIRAEARLGLGSVVVRVSVKAWAYHLVGFRILNLVGLDRVRVRENQ